MNDAYAERRARMVAEQVAARGVRDPRVLAAMRCVPRHAFVPAELVGSAYDDSPLPIGHDATISQPFIVGYMTEQLAVEAHHRVLEIGAGSGYQTAVLAELAADVFAVELVPELAARAESALRAGGYAHVRLRAGNGYGGWPEHAPYDRILAAAAADHIPQPLIDQLAVGGRLVLPVGTAWQQIRVVTRSADGVAERTTIDVRFVPLVSEPPAR